MQQLLIGRLTSGLIMNIFRYHSISNGLWATENLPGEEYLTGL